MQNSAKETYDLIEPTNCSHTICVSAIIQPIADWVAKNLEIISKFFQLSTRRTRILVRFIISAMLSPGTHRKSHGQNTSTLTKFGRAAGATRPTRAWVTFATEKRFCTMNSFSVHFFFFFSFSFFFLVCLFLLFSSFF